MYRTGIYVYISCQTKLNSVNFDLKIMKNVKFKIKLICTPNVYKIFPIDLKPHGILFEDQMTKSI